jgi:CRP-like cAMP-binding protein
MEAWASMQARPGLRQRLLGLLSLLAATFGRSHAEGMMIDVRLTHAELASAIGATRSTITRLLSELRRERLVVSEGRGRAERFVIREERARDGKRLAS